MIVSDTPFVTENALMMTGEAVDGMRVKIPYCTFGRADFHLPLAMTLSISDEPSSCGENAGLAVDIPRCQLTRRCV